MKTIEKLNSGDFIKIDLFGKEENVEVFSTGDNQFNENGDYKDDGFALTDEEITCLNWFIENVKIEDYREAITQYCNEQYDAIGGKQIAESDIENEITIFAVAINISEITQSNDGFIYRDP